jgi:hypothetical protein
MLRIQAIESEAQPSPPEPTMRQERIIQATIFEVFARHEIGCELKAISQWLDRQRPLVSLVAGDLRRSGLRETGRRGLPAETVLRCALLPTAAVELRRAGLSPRGFGIVSCLCPTAAGLVPEEIGAAPDDQRDPPGDLGGG